jgi:hypothetical protein
MDSACRRSPDATLVEAVAQEMRCASLLKPTRQERAQWTELHPVTRDYWMDRAMMVLAVVARLYRP